MKQFDITYFYGPYAENITDEKIVADIAASGFTLIPLTHSTKVNKQALPVLNRFGLRAIIYDPRIKKIYNDDNFKDADATVKKVVNDYKNYTNVFGWEIVDEPDTTKFPILSAIVNAFRRYSPDKETVINLFPNYATSEQLAARDYNEYLEKFVNVVRPHFLSYDHYHFLGRENRNKNLNLDVDERERLIRIAAEKTENRAGFFENIEEFRSVALKYDLDQMLIVLLIEHGPYRNLTFNELLWEVNMCLVYGMKRISYFTYWQPDDDVDHWQWTNAMCDVDGNRLEHWYDVQKINSSIAPIGRHLFNTKTEAVFHIKTKEAGTTAFKSYGAVTSVEGNNGVIGFFEDGSIYLVNCDFLNKNTFTLHLDSPVSIFTDGYFVLSDKKDITVELEAGGAVLLKV